MNTTDLLAIALRLFALFLLYSAFVMGIQHYQYIHQAATTGASDDIGALRLRSEGARIRRRRIPQRSQLRRHRLKLGSGLRGSVRRRGNLAVGRSRAGLQGFDAAAQIRDRLGAS